MKLIARYFLYPALCDSNVQDDCHWLPAMPGIKKQKLKNPRSLFKFKDSNFNIP